MMTRPLNQSVVLITGASRGIGREVAIQCAEAGARVHVCARSSAPLDALAAAHTLITPHVCDLQIPAQLDALFARIQQLEGHIDVLVNNASVLGATGDLTQIDDEAWRHTLDINVNGTFFVTRRALPLLCASSLPPALIVNLSSSVGRQARKHWGAYSISKFAIEGFTQLLTDELSHAEVVAVSLNPGGTATEMRAEAYPDEDPDTLPSAEQVARTVLCLIAHVGSHQAGAQFSSRQLFDVLSKKDLTGSTLPRDN